MKTYKIELARVEYYSQVIEVEADSEDNAKDKAWDKSGNWKLVDAEEFTNTILEVV
jgi:hypothetical protein